MTYNLLLIGESKQQWLDILLDATAALGDVDVCTERQSDARVEKGDYDLVIIDATEVGHPEELVLRLNRQAHRYRIIIATAVPTWQNAREAFRAGAHDYIRKYSDKEKLTVFLEQTLSKPITC